MRLRRRSGERLSALHTKRAYLPVLVGRVRHGWEPVRDAALARDSAEGGYGLDLGRGSSWGFVADVESLLTALHSTLDVAVGLAKVVERRVLRLERSHQTSEALLRALPGISPEELELFRDVRGGFVHNYSAWLAVVIDGSQADLAILTRRTQTYETGEGYVLLSGIGAVLRTLLKHIDTLEDPLANRVSQLGR